MKCSDDNVLCLVWFSRFSIVTKPMKTKILLLPRLNDTEANMILVITFVCS